jgi:hypothetical protein
MESSRYKADSSERYRLYFNLLAKKVREFKVLPRDTYNMDEKGFMLRVIRKLKEYLIRCSTNRDNISNLLTMPAGSR